MEVTIFSYVLKCKLQPFKDIIVLGLSCVYLILMQVRILITLFC